MWRAYKAAGRPFPQLSSDDVTDYLITEAVALKAAREDQEAQKEAADKEEMKRKKEEAKEKLKRMFR